MRLHRCENGCTQVVSYNINVHSVFEKGEYLCTIACFELWEQEVIIDVISDVQRMYLFENTSSTHVMYEIAKK